MYVQTISPWISIPQVPSVAALLLFLFYNRDLLTNTSPAPSLGGASYMLTNDGRVRSLVRNTRNTRSEIRRMTWHLLEKPDAIHRHTKRGAEGHQKPTSFPEGAPRHGDAQTNS